VRQARVAAEAGAPVGQGVAEDRWAALDPVVAPGPETSDARLIAARTRPVAAAASSTAVMAAGIRPLTVRHKQKAEPADKRAPPCYSLG
jgi:hypothetical protein